MGKQSWIILSLVMQFLLTPHFQQISLKSHLLRLLVSIITNRLFSLEQHYYTMKVQIHLSGFLDKCTACIRRKEKYEDYKSCHTDPVLCLSNLPLLKTAAESYTRTLYSEFEEEFKKQFSLSCVLLGTEGTISTYKVTSFQYKNDEAIVTFNPSTLDISCSCRLYGCVGILCKHIHKVFTCCNIITLPSHYILNRWTKYAKQEIFTSKLNNNDSLEFMFAHTSRKMMSLALKCKSSKEVLRYLNDGIDKLALEAGELLSKVNLDEVEDPESSAESTEEISKTMVPFKTPERVKARMEKKRSKDALEGAKKSQKKGNFTVMCE
nr:protein FAR1-RELATED SEQUENCE 9-like [Lolium perenne]